MTMITYRESVVNHINITTGDMLAWNLRLQGVPLKCTWTVDQRSGLQHHAVSSKRWSPPQLHLKPQNQTSIQTNMTLTVIPWENFIAFWKWNQIDKRGTNKHFWPQNHQKIKRDWLFLNTGFSRGTLYACFQTNFFNMATLSNPKDQL